MILSSFGKQAWTLWKEQHSELEQQARADWQWKHHIWTGEGLSINYVIADRGGGVSPKDYSIT